VSGQGLPPCWQTTGVDVPIAPHRCPKGRFVRALSPWAWARADMWAAAKGTLAPARAAASRTRFETAIVAASLLAETTRSADSVASEPFLTASPPLGGQHSELERQRWLCNEFVTQCRAVELAHESPVLDVRCGRYAEPAHVCAGQGERVVERCSVHRRRSAPDRRAACGTRITGRRRFRRRQAARDGRGRPAVMALPAGANANGAVPGRSRRTGRRVRAGLARDWPACQVSLARRPSGRHDAAGLPASCRAARPGPPPSGPRSAAGLSPADAASSVTKRLNKSQQRNYTSPGKTPASSWQRPVARPFSPPFPERLGHVCA